MTDPIIEQLKAEKPIAATLNIRIAPAVNGGFIAAVNGQRYIFPTKTLLNTWLDAQQAAFKTDLNTAFAS